MSLVLVTGGTGFIGSHLVQTLLADGHRLRCVVRDRRRLRWLNGLGIETVESNLSDSESLLAAMHGVQYVYHLAGAAWAASSARFDRDNAAATLNLLQACDRGAPELTRFIYVSTQAAAGPSVSGRWRNEEDPPAPITAYGRSKLSAESHVLEYKKRFGTVILRPTAVYGPRDTGFLPYFRLVRRGFLVEFGAGEREVSLCHVDDVVQGLIKASNSQVASGSVYFLGDSEPYPWREVELGICIALELEPRRIVVPPWLLEASGALGQLYGRVTGKATVLNRSRVAEILERRWGCDVSKARSELGFAPETKLHDGLSETARWYKQQKWL